jgi:hypothetical protein
MEESKKISTIVNCFVDLNLETNENFLYSDIDTRKVSFDKFFNSVDEGSFVTITIGLNSPSEFGIEQAKIVLINKDTEEIDFEQLDFPKKIKWEIGEQFKEFKIYISNDFYEERKERFYVSITSLINLLPGKIMRSVVEVVDKTVLKTASFSSSGASIVNLNSIDKELQFRISNGETVNIAVGLDSPSEYGIENIDVEFFDTTNFLNSFIVDDNAQILSREQLSFSVGDQYKTSTIIATQDSDFRKIGFRLTNPSFVKITENELYSQGKIVLTNNLYNVLYTTFVIDDIFKQKGKVYDGITSSPTELRYISDEENITSTNSRFTASWLVRYNFSYKDSFNDTVRQESANYPSYPNYNFSKIKLVVVNKGEFAVEYAEQIYKNGESFEIDITDNKTSITLPTNTNPASSISEIDGKESRKQTLTSSRYEFSFKYYEDKFYDTNGVLTFPHGFIIKGAVNDVLSIGEFTKKGFEYSDSTLNPFSLITTYSSMKTNYNGLCNNDFDIINGIKDIKIKGIILLDASEQTSNYLSFDLINSEINPVCEVKNGNEFSTRWTTMPFDVF